MSNKIQKVIFYIDGFNFYYGLKSQKWKKYYWLDMVKFCEQFLRPHQELTEVNYFSATPNNNRGKYDRQDLFFSANKVNPKFNLHLGKFLEKKITCKQCKGSFITHEEKETDVHIATNMIGNVVLGKCDVSVLISADSDLIPPINFINEYDPTHKIFVYFPPNRFSNDLKNKAHSTLFLKGYAVKFDTSIFPDKVTLANGHIIERPAKWI